MSALVLRALGILLVLTALALALSRAPDRSVESLVARWAPPPSEFIEMKGQLVHLRDVGPRGDPEPIVLIHGTSASLHTWDGWVRSLATQRRVISFDLPGFGLTGPFGGAYARDDYRGATYARFLLDLLDELKLERVVLAGNSLGGEVAWRTAVLAPQRVSRLILVDAAGPAFTPESMPLGFVIATVPLLNRVTEWVLPRSLVAEGVANVYGDPSKVTPELVDRYFELTLREGNRRALGERMRQYMPGEDAGQIQSVRVPTLILWGGKDRLIPPAVAKEFERAIAGSRLVMFPALGHVPQEEDPAATVAAVKAFLGLP
jgi:pimeloyl-ACP methyl ester carboxylesterase